MLDRSFRKLVDEKTGLQAPQLFILGYLSHKQGSVHQKDIEALTGNSSPAISNAITRLERIGDIVRVEDPLDRRYRRIELTEKGRKTAESGYRAFRMIDDDLRQALTPEELDCFRRISKKLEDRIEELRKC